MKKTKKHCLIAGTTLVVVPALVLFWHCAVPFWLWCWSQSPFWTGIFSCILTGIGLLIYCLPEPPPMRPVTRCPIPPPQSSVGPKP